MVRADELNYLYDSNSTSFNRVLPIPLGEKKSSTMSALLIVDLQRWFLEVGSEEKLRLVSNDAYELDFKVILAGEAILGTQIKYGELMLDSLKRRFEITPLSNKEIMESLVRNVD